MKFPVYDPKLASLLAKRGVTPGYVANFDSSSTTLHALARFLHGKDFPGVGLVSSSFEPLMAAINHLPVWARERLYIWSGRGDAMPEKHVDSVRAEVISQWATSLYPKRQYPAVMLGSSNGAATHLCAALGIPWLPQTVLTLVRRSGVPIDEPRADLEWGMEPAQCLLDANPDLRVYQMHDPNQDRLMIQKVGYLRVKRLRLGETYRRFLAECLEPGGTLFLLECQRSWPATQVTERHIFQQGGQGGATFEEYFHGGPRVEDFLRRYGSKQRCWDAPPPDGMFPESEWGFDPELRDDVETFARQNGYRIRRIVFDDPEDLSPLVADLHRWWYGERGLHTSRLLVDSFVYMDPWWTLRLGAVPYWSVFSVQPSVERLASYLDATAPYDDIYVGLLSHGTESIGLASLDQWRAILRRAGRHGAFVGVDERRYPRDFRSVVRFHLDLKQIPSRYPISEPLALNQLDAFLDQAGHRYPVSWITQPATVEEAGA